MAREGRSRDLEPHAEIASAARKPQAPAMGLRDLGGDGQAKP